MFRFLIDEETLEGKKKVMSTACIYALMSTFLWCGLGYSILSIIGYEFSKFGF